MSNASKFNLSSVTGFSTRLANLVALMTILIFLNDSQCHAQRQPVVLTLKNTLELEGQTFEVDSVSKVIGQFMPNGKIQVVDTGCKRVFFNRKLLVPQVPEPGRLTSSREIWQKTYGGTATDEGRVVAFGEFDEFGHRRYSVLYPDGEIVHFMQGITKMTPRYVELETLVIPDDVQANKRKQRKRPMSVATSSIPPDVLRSVLYKTVSDRDDETAYLEFVEFFLEAELFKEALDEQARTLRRFPHMRNDKSEQDLNMLRQAYTREILKEVKLRDSLGQPELAFTLAGVVNTEQVAGETRAELDAVQLQIRNRKILVDETRTRVNAFISNAIDSNKYDDKGVAALRRLMAELETDLNANNISRLDSFLRLITDDTISEEEKLALAISGWLVDSNKAIRNFAVSVSMFPVRDIVFQYLNSDPQDKMQRAGLLDQLKPYEAGLPTYLAQIIAAMKPPRHDRLETYVDGKPIEFSVTIPRPGEGTETATCLAHVPPEYDPYRRYPCIITLRPGINTEAQLNRWCGSYDEKLSQEIGSPVRNGRAMRHGYIVVSVDWKREGQTACQYSSREHAIVLKALRETLRTFSVDSDRVFLSGHSIGATAAYDIGVSHPEHWAGIAGFGGNLSKYPDQYRANKHVKLAIYVVMGDNDFGRIEGSKGALNQWLQSSRFLECMLVLYKGRGEVTYSRAGQTAEEFSEELPEIFKWMDAQRRIRPDGDSFELECKTLRPWDNYYWFWEVSGLPEDRVTRPEHWRDRGHNSLDITAKIRGNRFYVGPANQGTGGQLSLSPEFVDFSKKIEVGGRGDFDGHVAPSASVMLEDVRRRGDRQHPYWAKLNCDGKRWSIADH